VLPSQMPKKGKPHSRSHLP